MHLPLSAVTVSGGSLWKSRPCSAGIAACVWTQPARCLALRTLHEALARGCPVLAASGTLKDKLCEPMDGPGAPPSLPGGVGPVWASRTLLEPFLAPEAPLRPQHSSCNWLLQAAEGRATGAQHTGLKGGWPLPGTCWVGDLVRLAPCEFLTEASPGFAVLEDSIGFLGSQHA